jgi:hypothetical protein
MAARKLAMVEHQHALYPPQHRARASCQNAELPPSQLNFAKLRAALTKCPSEAAGLSGRGGARVYRGGAFFGLVHDELGKAKGCSRWSSTDGFATPAMSRG